MAFTLQRKLELAGDLAKVQPLLHRLHILEKPKKRHYLRNVVIVCSAIGAGAVVAIMARRRRGDHNAIVGGSGFTQDSPEVPDIPATAVG